MWMVNGYSPIEVYDWAYPDLGWCFKRMYNAKWKSQHDGWLSWRFQVYGSNSMFPRFLECSATGDCQPTGILKPLKWKGSMTYPTKSLPHQSEIEHKIEYLPTIWSSLNHFCRGLEPNIFTWETSAEFPCVDPSTSTNYASQRISSTSSNRTRSAPGTLDSCFILSRVCQLETCLNYIQDSPAKEDWPFTGLHQPTQPAHGTPGSNPTAQPTASDERAKIIGASRWCDNLVSSVRFHFCRTRANGLSDEQV